MQINSFHYTKPEVFKKSSNTTIFDIDVIALQKDKQYPDHYVLILSNNTLYSKNKEIINSFNYFQDNDEVYLDITHQLDKPICLINLLSDGQTINITIAKNLNINIVHEDFITQSGHVNFNINNYGILNYYNLAHNYTDSCLYKNIVCNNHNKMHLFFIQNKNSLLYKLDCTVNLYKDSNVNIDVLNYLQHKQLKDDCFEIKQIEENTHSKIKYLSLNDGKAVSQINNIVEINSLNSSLEQHIKHILLSERGSSFSKPSLMIHCPTVASHGNTISSFPPEWLFYLYQKGISPEKAQTIIEQSLIKNVCSHTPYEHQFVDYLGGQHG